MAKKVENRGNKPLKKVEPLSNPERVRCLCCNDTYQSRDFHDSKSEIYRGDGKVPYCKPCLIKLYEEYLRVFTVKEYENPSRKAVERICMMLDMYYSDKLFDSALKESQKETNANRHLLELYIKQTNLYQYSQKSYDSTLDERYKIEREECAMPSSPTDKTEEELAIIKKATKLFGKGFQEDDYLYLQEQYDDWTSRHECNTKAQEEVFKRLCFIQLDTLKATRRGDSTEKLDATFDKLLGTGKLQPKQNANDAVSDAQTFGTLIDKWENTRPIPEVDEELRDVDNIGLYIDVFFRGHTARMLGVKNALSNLYTKFMNKYTVSRPEYKDDEDNDALFDAIFGSVHDGDD